MIDGVVLNQPLVPLGDDGSVVADVVGGLVSGGGVTGDPVSGFGWA